jgi:dTDP-4-dehydrorhamnose reductase
MNTLIVGVAGQLGRALQQVVRVDAIVTAPPEAECNLTDAFRVAHWLEQVRPDVVFNAAAYTAVDAAERDIAAAELANVSAVAAVGRCCGSL